MTITLWQKHAMLVAWGGIVLASLGGMAVYQSTPGAVAADVDANALRRVAAHHDAATNSSKATHRLLVFAHPRCPCTEATIAELSRLVTWCAGRLDAEVYFYQPSGEPDAWSKTSLWEAADRIDGVRVRVDRDGTFARECDVSTSGQVLLINTEGHLLFSGGITPSRSHHGDNDGSAAIVAHITRGNGDASTPVFGCEIFNVTEGQNQ